MKYKVGDRVKIKKHVLGCCEYDNCMGFVSEMRSLVGKKLTVRDAEHGFYMLDDGHGAVYSNCMIEPATSKKTLKKVAKKVVKKKSTKKPEFEYITFNGVLYQKVSEV